MVSNLTKIICIATITIGVMACTSTKLRGPASTDVEAAVETFKNICETQPLPENDSIYSKLGAQSREFEAVLKDGELVDLNCNFANLGVRPMMVLFRNSELRALCPNAKLKNRDGYPINRNISDYTQSVYGPGDGTISCCIGCSSLN